jgi:gluconolactonase
VVDLSPTGAHGRLADLVNATEDLVTLADGFQFTEGPVWHPTERHLTFSDIPASRMFRWNAADGLQVLRDPSHKANGNAYDRQGRLITCEHATSRLTRTEPDGTVVVLADTFAGRELNSPNDVIVARDGTIYFTDPVYGRTMDAVGVLREVPQPARGVYRLIPESGRLTLLIWDCQGPNGLCLSGDERFLFVNDSDRGHIRRFQLDGEQVVADEVWAEPNGTGPGGVDGMKVDSLDNLYCTGPGGVFVYDPTGEALGVIHVPEGVGNFTWGGDDLRTLYLCATTSVYSCRTHVPGLPAF